MQPSQTSGQRVQSVDILRGLVMIIMALDHVREYFHVQALTGDPTDLATTTPVLFFTRWITHFCAPVFVFLSGTSAFLSGRKKSKKDLSIFLIKRGLWLVLAEMLIISLGLTFNPLYNLLIWQVIWAIGWSMVILGLLVRFRVSIIAAVGCIILFGHNLTDYMTIPRTGAEGFAWNVLLTARGSIYPIAPQRFIFDFYAILPWTGVMLLGYVFGTIYTSMVNTAERNKKLLLIGGIVTGIFIILRLINRYGDPAPWSNQKSLVYTLLSFLNTTKYPCSLMYVCMTIGPAIILLSFMETWQNRLSRIATVYGRVPFFYYILHFYLAHFLLVIAFFVTGHGRNEIVDQNSPFLFRPVVFGFPLWSVYLIWLFVVALLYRPCKWFHQYKLAHRQWWLKYM